MNTVIRAMTEEQHDKRSWRSSALIGMFLGLSLTLSFSVRQQSIFVKDAIRTYNNNNNNKANLGLSAGSKPGVDDDNPLDPDKTLAVFTTAITMLQAIVTAICLITDSTNVKGECANNEAYAIIAVAHVGSTFLRDFLTDVGMVTNDQLIVQDVAFFAPVLTLAALWLVTSVPAKPTTWVSLFMIGCGCSMVSNGAGTLNVMSSHRVALICGLAFFSVAMRNIVVRHLVHGEGVEIKARPLPYPYTEVNTWTAVSVLGAFGVLSVFLLAPQGWGWAALNAAVTCSVSCSLFLVTSHVIKMYGVTYTALLTVWALFVEALIATPSSLRPGVVSSLLGLILLIVGHWLYVRSMYEVELGLAPIADKKSATLHEQYTRLEFFLFTCAVLGIIFYVFQPRVSERDLDTLSYVGLDQVLRRLLSVAS